MAKDGAAEALGQLATERVRRDRTPATTPLELLDLANENAIEWAEDHAAELVGMHRNNDGSWSKSKRPGMAISKTTRDGIKEMVADAMRDGSSNDSLADTLADAWEFSEERAESIARTETCRADLEGTRIGWRESGMVVGRKWIVAQDEACDDCLSMDGEEVGVDEEFEGGDAPRHPSCRCDELPILADEEE
jgi:SPP1 gp7 family putative phage head morphogenesis protein